MGHYFFGPYSLDAQQRILLLGGSPVSLPLKAYETLLALVQSAGRVVLKRDLLDRVWPDSFVEENSLSQNISLLRRTLTEPPGAAYIETVPKRGFRFVREVVYVPPKAPALAPLAERIETRYARSGDVNIAYQVYGGGPVDLVFVMGWVSHLEYFWKEPHFARFLTRLARFSRVILFDKRGTGLSDRVANQALPTLEQRMEDVHAVMDATGSRRAVLLGVSEGGPMCALFAATYPERTAGLIMIGTYAKRIRSDDYPWGPTSEEHRTWLLQMADEWGGPVGLDVRAPSLAADEPFRDWWATYLRMGASPAAAVALTRMNSQIDVRHVLPLIRVPSLILHRTGDRCLAVDEGRYVARLIPEARFVELPGDDHLPFVGEQDELLREIEAFTTGLSDSGEFETVLGTVVLVQAGSEHAGWARDQLQGVTSWVQGPIAGATFQGPARAIRAAQRVLVSARALSLPARVVVHTGECLYRADGKVAGAALNVAAALLDTTRIGDLQVTRTVHDLVAGAGFRFTSRPALALPDASGGLHVFGLLP
ncbi:MAG: alpha/beta fold hydrolase [Acidobacteria bacterium]|nr:alpha/beta fold hydrolase [Acidobacteriota bacterium]